jgi:adenylate kinase
MTIIVLVGPPGSGKGTQSQMLIESLNVEHIAVGDILREEIQKGSELGLKAKKIIDKGNLLDDETVFDIVKYRLKKSLDVENIILDGYPRTVKQAELLQQYCNKCGLAPIKVIYFEVDINDERLQDRFANRFNCVKCGKVYNAKTNPPRVPGVCDDCKSTEFEVRVDDTKEVFEQRLKNYADKTQPVIDFYCQDGVLYNIDAGKNKQEVYEDVIKIIQEL